LRKGRSTTPDPAGAIHRWPNQDRDAAKHERGRSMGLLRSLLGSVLRQQRLRQGRTLRDVSASAQVSLGYISEVERGQKEASSELLAAICSALDVPLSDVLREVSEQMAFEEGVAAAEVAHADLAHADLAHADLAHADLAHADLADRNLDRVVAAA
jgi:XRE family transcriptional regulator, stress-response regulator